MGYPLFVRGCSLIHLLHLAVHLNKQTNKQTNKQINFQELMFKDFVKMEVASTVAIQIFPTPLRVSTEASKY